jgi:hypothetical protein
MPCLPYNTRADLRAFLAEEYARARQARCELVEARAHMAETLASSRELMAKVDDLLAWWNCAPR